jgi:sulfate transport system substrate-binding protein
VVDKFANKHKTQAVAQAYLQYLYSDEGQEIAARNHLRPVSETVAAKHAADFPKLELFTVNEVFGSWKQVEQKHFADGGVFDQIYSK